MRRPPVFSTWDHQFESQLSPRIVRKVAALGLVVASCSPRLNRVKTYPRQLRQSMDLRSEPGGLISLHLQPSFTGSARFMARLPSALTLEGLSS